MCSVFSFANFLPGLLTNGRPLHRSRSTPSPPVSPSLVTARSDLSRAQDLTQACVVTTVPDYFRNLSRDEASLPLAFKTSESIPIPVASSNNGMSCSRWGRADSGRLACWASRVLTAAVGAPFRSSRSVGSVACLTDIQDPKSGRFVASLP
jgi:hypothetical protein